GILPDEAREEQRGGGGGVAARRGQRGGRRRRGRGRVPGSGDLPGIRVDGRPLPLLHAGPEEAREEAGQPLGRAGQDDAAQVFLHLARVGVTALAILGERFGEDGIEGRERGIEL